VNCLGELFEHFNQTIKWSILVKFEFPRDSLYMPSISHSQFHPVEKTNRKVLSDHASYRPGIDGLRALAVAAVIANHFNAEVLPSGFLGVDIFFVISGFVVTSSLNNKPSQSLRDYLLTFYARRIRRLLPALAAIPNSRLRTLKNLNFSLVLSHGRT
jgi:hypothetical protein